MRLLTAPASARQLDSALLVIRVVAGSIFAAHGAQKLFVYGFAGVTGAFGQMGIPMPEIVGPFIALLEFFGGLALLFGLLTRLASLGLAFTMVGAILTVHLKNGLFLPNGSEFALSLLGSTVLLTLTGAGRFALDTLLPQGTPATDAPAPALRRAA